MTNLTEQWKQGELPDGWYWVEGSRAEGIYAYTAEYLNHMYRPRNSERIVEQVPSYEEWQAKLEENTKLKTENKWYSEQLNEAVKEVGQLKKWCEEFNALDVAKENTKLKELLKECRDKLDTYYEPTIKRIAQVLGEE